MTVPACIAPASCTATGADLFEVEPLPNCPDDPTPQQYAAPPAIAQVEFAPAEMAVTALDMVLVATALDR